MKEENCYQKTNSVTVHRHIINIVMLQIHDKGITLVTAYIFIGKGKNMSMGMQELKETLDNLKEEFDDLQKENQYLDEEIDDLRFEVIAERRNVERLKNILKGLGIDPDCELSLSDLDDMRAKLGNPIYMPWSPTTTTIIKIMSQG